MPVGEKIKRARKLRGLTQKELGKLLGFEDNTADVRVAQYESGIRTPKEPMLHRIAEVLNVGYRALCEPVSYSEEDIMYMLFELDEHYKAVILDVPPGHHENGQYSFQLCSELLDSFLGEWQQRKKDLAEGIIDKDEYTEWKMNWKNEK